jgi:hypothetical protein
MAVVEQAVGPDQIDILSESALRSVTLLLDLFQESSEIHRALNDCERGCGLVEGRVWSRRDDSPS